MYAELLCAKLSPRITKIINQKYIDLYDIKSTLYKTLKHTAELKMLDQITNKITFQRQNAIIDNFDNYIEELPRQINSFITPIILPQAIFFTLFYYEKYCIKVQLHMAGYQSFSTLTKDQLNLLYKLCKS